MPSVDISLKINNTNIEMDKITKSFIISTTMGMLSSLRGMEDTAEIENVKLAICGQDVSVGANGVEVGINSFIEDFIRNTIKAMISPLRGVEADIKTVEINIFLPLTNKP